MVKIHLAKRNHITSWLIRYFTKSKVSHMGIGDIDRNLVLHATSAGLHYSHTNYFFKKYDVVYSFNFIPSDTLHPYYLKTRKCFFKMLELLETPYDTGALIGFIPYIILKKMGYKKARNPFGSENVLFCSEILYKFLEYCIEEEIVRDDILSSYKREEFSPEDALVLMTKEKEYFELCKI